LGQGIRLFLAVTDGPGDRGCLLSGRDRQLALPGLRQRYRELGLWGSRTRLLVLTWASMRRARTR